MQTRRSGFSLIEVMIAMSICMFGLTVLLQMTALAQRYAQRSVELVEEQIIAQNILNEMGSGMRSGNQLRDEFSEQYPQYEFSVRSEPQQQLGLRLIEVVVRRVDSPGRIVAGTSQRPEETSSRERTVREFRLARLVRAEALDLDTPRVIPADRVAE